MKYEKARSCSFHLPKQSIQSVSESISIQLEHPRSQWIVPGCKWDHRCKMAASLLWMFSFQFLTLEAIGLWNWRLLTLAPGRPSSPGNPIAPGSPCSSQQQIRPILSYSPPQTSLINTTWIKTELLKLNAVLQGLRFHTFHWQLLICSERKHNFSSAIILRAQYLSLSIQALICVTPYRLQMG